MKEFHNFYAINKGQGIDKAVNVDFGGDLHKYCKSKYSLLLRKKSKPTYVDGEPTYSQTYMIKNL